MFLAATFDFSAGTMALYKNGKPCPGSYTVAGDPWEVDGPGPESPRRPIRAASRSAAASRRTPEGNPCNCRMDTIELLDRAATPKEVAAQYRLMTR